MQRARYEGKRGGEILTILINGKDSEWEHFNLSAIIHLLYYGLGEYLILTGCRVSIYFW